jgi:hypothetical protein
MGSWGLGRNRKEGVDGRWSEKWEENLGWYSYLYEKRKMLSSRLSSRQKLGRGPVPAQWAGVAAQALKDHWAGAALRTIDRA